MKVELGGENNFKVHRIESKNVLLLNRRQP